MSNIKSFEDLKVWELAQGVYELTQVNQFHNDFSLVNQINKSSGSVMDNIAEGFERGGNKELSQFLFIAKGSCGEMRSQLYRALDRKHIHKTEFESFAAKATEVSKQLSGFISYLKSSELKGIKYARESEVEYGPNFEF